MELYKFKGSDQIGSLDAETDNFLSYCFLESNVYSTLKMYNHKDADFVKRIIVGRTGSGKTAILKKLTDDPSIKQTSVIEAESTVFEHINNNIFISKLIETGIDLRVFYKSLWIHVLLIRVITLIYKNDKTFYEKIQTLVMTKQQRYNLKLANEYINKYKDNFFNERIVSEITQTLQNELNSHIGEKIIGISVKNNVNAVHKIQTETARFISNNLLKKQKELIKLITEESPDETQNRIIISIDDLDKSWLSDSSIRYNFINSLLDAFKELINLKSVKILISIRTDILMGIYNTNLRQEEKDRSLIIPIEWSKCEITEIIDKRISYLLQHKYATKSEVKFSDIFNFKVKNEDASDYIISRTMLRPRDAIDFVNYCLMQSDKYAELNEDLVIEAEEKYYTSRKNALKKEWVSQYKNITNYIDVISLVSKKEFRIIELNKDTLLTFLVEKLDNNDPVSEGIAMDINKLVNVWFTIGLIGIKKTETLTVYSSFDKPNLDISDYNKLFIVHPLFFRI